MLGFGYIIAFPYGDYPVGPYAVPEHRIFEQLSWNESFGRVSLNHRLRMEQRYLGKVDQKAAEYDRTGWTYVDRVRYQLRLNVPINHPAMRDKTVYVAAYDELFMGFGTNVNQNVFDQNRFGALAGYQFNSAVRVEAGFLSQTVLQAKLVSARQVYQYNNGMIASVYLTLKRNPKAVSPAKP